MKKILLSLIALTAVASVVVGATRAVFTSQAVLGSNTFATGVLEIRINGQQTAAGFTFTNAAPGDSVTKTFSIQNYGSPWFPGPSTLPAKGLLATSSMTSGGGALFDVLEAQLYANAGWSGCSNAGVTFDPVKGCEVYNGLLKDMSGEDILHATQWGVHPDLIPGNSFSMTLDVTLPTTADDSVQGMSTVFDLLVDASNP